MTAYSAQQESSPSYGLVETLREARPTRATAAAKPPVLTGHVFTFPQTILPTDGGKVLLHLYEPPRLRLDIATFQCEVLDWDFSVPCSAIHELPRRMARRFLELFGKAERQQLTSEESQSWLKILQRTNYSQFCVDRAAPQYMEGKFIGRTPPRVEWSDGTLERLSPDAALSLSLLEPGDTFSAFVKIGMGNDALGIERVSLIAQS